MMTDEQKIIDKTASSVGSEGTAADETNAPEPTFGWTPYAELINGRFAMIGFMALIIIELVTHQSFWQWVGLQ